MILVAGGTGTLGSRLVARLGGRGEAVRILTRDPARAAPLLTAGSVEVVGGDVRDPASLEAAVRGADTVVSAVHGFAGPRGISPDSVDRRGNVNLIRAVAGRGTHVVLVSVVGASDDHPMELFRAKFSAERALTSAGIPWTIVRATAFIETWGTILGDPLRKSGRMPVFGRGDNPINFVSVADVAAAAERAVVDPALRNRTVEIGGPDNYTFNQLAGLIEEAVGRRGTVIQVPRTVLRIMATLTAIPRPALARQARAALTMDTVDMTFDSTGARPALPHLPPTDVRTALKELYS